jgi:hypothetical protein
MHKHRVAMVAALLLFLASVSRAQETEPAKIPPPQRTIPRQQPDPFAAILGSVRDDGGRAVVGMRLQLLDGRGAVVGEIATNADGIFRLLRLRPGRYRLQSADSGQAKYGSREFQLAAGDVATLEITLPKSNISPAQPPWRGVGPPPAEATTVAEIYRELPSSEGAPTPGVTPPPANETVYQPMPDRWSVVMPDWKRYNKAGEFPYVKGQWWNPFQRNRIKGDSPIVGQRTFLNLTATSNSFMDLRRLPLASGVSAQNPGETGFFGRGEEFLLSQTFRFSLDLFHGDTSYRPVDWRIRITPAVDINYLHTRERGIVNIDVRHGNDRLDTHAGVQEAFVEYKIHDLSPNYDFVSVRAGIQQFTSDFRGFLFVDEQPGVRVFGNFDSNRWQYNAAYFFMLEKDTNSRLNRFGNRRQQVWIANVYRQDFIWKGYTTQFSFHYNFDQASVKFDTNGFLVRPAPIGIVRPHTVKAAYAGWTGSGHIGRANVSHAFYQAFGRDSSNLISGGPVYINARMAALELSLDRDWARFRSAFFFASGDRDPRHGPAGGFDTIVDSTSFAGGIFSFWNREAIRLTSTGVNLVGEDSLLPSLRSNKFQGQANFVNPGIVLGSVGGDFDVTPKLQSFVTANFMRFHHTAPLELLLFQRPIPAAIGGDYSLGVRYRPLLSENAVVRAGVSAFTPWEGFQRVFTGRTLFSVFTNVQFKF